MSTSTPWILRYLICNAGVNGACHLDERTLTAWDNFHACQAHICRDKAEWDRRAKDNVAKDRKRFWMAVELYNPATKERRKVTDDLRIDLEAQFNLDCIKATLQSYAGQPATVENLQECLDRITNAVRGTVVHVVGQGAKAILDNLSPQTDDGTSQSGNTPVEGVEVPESTLSVEDAETPEVSPDVIGEDTPVAQASPAKAGTPNAKPKPPAKKAAKAKK